MYAYLPPPIPSRGGREPPPLAGSPLQVTCRGLKRRARRLAVTRCKKGAESAKIPRERAPGAGDRERRHRAPNVSRMQHGSSTSAQVGASESCNAAHESCSAFARSVPRCTCCAGASCASVPNRAAPTSSWVTTVASRARVARTDAQPASSGCTEWPPARAPRRPSLAPHALDAPRRRHWRTYTVTQSSGPAGVQPWGSEPAEGTGADDRRRAGRDCSRYASVPRSRPKKLVRP